MNWAPKRNNMRNVFLGKDFATNAEYGHYCTVVAVTLLASKCIFVILSTATRRPGAQCRGMRNIGLGRALPLLGYVLALDVNSLLAADAQDLCTSLQAFCLW